MTSLVQHPLLAKDSLHPDVALVDPLMSFTWRGRDRVAAVLDAIGSVAHDLEYTDELAGVGTRALRFRLRVDGHRVEGMHHLELDEEGRVLSISISMRPLASVQALAVSMADHLPGLLAGRTLNGGELAERRFTRHGPETGVDFLGPLTGFTVDTVHEGQVMLTGEPGATQEDRVGAVDRGFAATLLDSVMGWAVHTTLPPGGGYTTFELHTTHLPAATPGGHAVRCVGTVVQRSPGVVLAEGRLSGAGGELLASATATYLVNEGLP
ncbi:MAG: PaaI family thioesterase [Gaiellaceae bacterium]